MADEVGSLVVRLAMSDTSFQQGIQNLNREMKVIESEFKTVMSSSANFGTSLDGLKAKAQFLSDSMKNQAAIMDKYKTALQNSEQKLKDVAGQQEQLKIKVESAQQAWKQAEAQHGKNAEVTQQLKQEYKELSDEYSQNDKRIRTYVKTIDNQNIAINKAQTNINEYKQELASVNTEISKTTSGFYKFQQNLQSVGESMQTMGSKLSDVGKELTAKVSVPLTAMSGIAIKTGADFEQAMAQVGAISGATGEDLALLEQKARDMGSTTIFSASQSAEALNYMAMAGWNTQDMVSGLEGIMNLAAASGENLGTVSDIVTDALTAFGLSAAESGRFADVLAMASSKSNTNVAMMGETFSYVAPIAGALGFSIEDTALAIGLMANSGIKASQAGTSLRQIIMGLQGDVEVTSGSFGKMTIETTNLDGTMKDFDEIIIQLRDSFSKMTEEEKAMNAEHIAGKIGMSGLLAIVNSSQQDFLDLGQAINTSTGSAQTMATTMNDTVQGSFKILMSAVQELCITLFERLEPVLRDIIQRLTEFVTNFTQLPDWFQNLAIGATAFAIALGPLLSLLGVMISGIGKLITSLGSLSALASPLGLILAGVATAIGLVTAEVVRHQTQQNKLNQELRTTIELQGKGIDANEQTIKQTKDEMEILDKKIKTLESLQQQQKNNAIRYEELRVAAEAAAKAQDGETYQELYEEMQKLEGGQSSLSESINQVEVSITSQYGQVQNAKERVEAYNIAISNAQKEQTLLDQCTNEATRTMTQEGITLNKNAREASVLKDRYRQLASQQNINSAESKELESIKNRLIELFGASVVEIDKETGIAKINTIALQNEITANQDLANVKLEAVRIFNEGSKQKLIIQKHETETMLDLLMAQFKAAEYVDDAMGINDKIVKYRQKSQELERLIKEIDAISVQSAATIVESNKFVEDELDEINETATNATKERQKTQLEIAMETYEQKRKLGQLTFEEELTSLEQMRQQHAKTNEEIIQVNEFAQSRIVELIKFRKETEQLTLEEELALYEQAKQKYCQNEQDKSEFNKLISQAIIEDSISLTENVKEMNSEQLQVVKDTLLEKKYLYEDDKAVCEEIDRQLLDVKKEMYSQEVDELKDTVDKLIAERERQYNEELGLIDKDLQEKLDGYQGQLDAIEELEKEQRQKDKEANYEKQIARLEDKLREEEDYKKRQEIRDEIRNVELEREKWILEEKRKAEKDSIKQQMDDAKEEAKRKKEELKEQLEQEKIAMEEHQLFQQEWLRVKFENSHLTEQEITQKTLDEINQREKDLETAMTRQLQVYRNQIPSIENIGNEYGDKLLQGIKSTESLIDAYINRKIQDMQNQVNSVSFKSQSSYGTPMSGYDARSSSSRSVESRSLFDLTSYSKATQDSMNNVLQLGQKSANVKTQFYEQNAEPQTLEVTHVDTSKLEDLLEKVNSKLDRLPKVFRQEARMG